MMLNSFKEAVDFVSGTYPELSLTTVQLVAH